MSVSRSRSRRGPSQEGVGLRQQLSELALGYAAQLLAGALHVMPSRPDRDAELGGDLLGGEPLGRQPLLAQGDHAALAQDASRVGVLAVAECIQAPVQLV